MPVNPQTKPNSTGVEIKIVTNDGKTEQRKFEQYELDQMARTLCEAEEIKADPAKMAAVKPLLEKKTKAIKSLDQLRKIASKKISRKEQYSHGPSTEEGSSEDDPVPESGSMEL